VSNFFKEIRKIDNRQIYMPGVTTFLIIFIIGIVVWFFHGGSFKLYASIFFSLYHITGQIWISVMLIGIVQNIAFLPLRFIGMRLSKPFDDFEEKIKEQSQQEAYLLFKNKVQKGDSSMVFYIFNFIVNAIALVSAGRIFLIDFYHQKLNPNLLYNWAPYPNYPLKGTYFKLPFFKVTEFLSLSWGKIFMIWIGITLFFAVIRILWRLSKWLLAGNKGLLKARIGYNRLLIKTSGFSLTFLILSIIFLRNIPIKFQFITLVADLTRQNSTMNFITAVGTFLTTIHAGLTRIKIDSEILRLQGVAQKAITELSREKIRESLRNALILGAGAFFVTNHIPCAFELSVATFELLYILSPYTFDKILIRAGAQQHKLAVTEDGKK